MHCVLTAFEDRTACFSLVFPYQVVIFMAPGDFWAFVLVTSDVMFWATIGSILNDLFSRLKTRQEAAAGVQRWALVFRDAFYKKHVE